LLDECGVGGGFIGAELVVEVDDMGVEAGLDEGVEEGDGVGAAADADGVLGGGELR
jgi:hypothetical protein